MTAAGTGGTVHVIGAGLAGLSAAVRLCEAGVRVRVYEAAKVAGGRCRSFYDDHLNAVIDNGTHLVLSGNREVRAFLDLTGGAGQMIISERARFPFHDVRDGTSWAVDLGRGRSAMTLLGWLHDKARQPRGFRTGRFLKDVHALKRGQGKAVADCVKTGTELYEAFWRPLTLAVLNAEPEVGDAGLLWTVLQNTVLKGGRETRPVFAAESLGAMLVDPAVAFVTDHGGEIGFQRRAQTLEVEGNRAQAIAFANAVEVLKDTDAVVLAVPHNHAPAFVDGLLAPQAHQAILNVHYKVGRAAPTPSMVGLVGGAGEWLFHRKTVASITISAANDWMGRDGDAIAAALWPDVSHVLGTTGAVPPFRVIKEKRATFAARPGTPRPDTRTGIENVFLAGDWTDTGMPATLEGAVLSGRKAADAVLESWA